MESCDGRGELLREGCAQELDRDKDGKLVDPKETDQLSEANLRTLQLTEIRRMLGLSDNAPHREVIRQLALRERSLFNVPRRYLNYPSIMSLEDVWKENR